MSLIGERVVLRPARPEDADALAQGFADDPTLGAMLGIEPDEESAEWLRSTFPEDGENGEQRAAYWFAIADPDSGELIGEIGLIGISWPNRRARLSILVLPGSRRAGVGRGAIELLLGWAQGELGSAPDRAAYAPGERSHAGSRRGIGLHARGRPARLQLRTGPLRRHRRLRPAPGMTAGLAGFARPGYSYEAPARPRRVAQETAMARGVPEQD